MKPVAQDSYAHLPRARRHSRRSLRHVREATSAHERRAGVSPGPAPRELAAVIPAWPGRREMIRVIRGLASQPRVRQLCRSKGIAVSTWQAVMINDAIDADGSTGRGIRTSRVVAAQRVQRDPEVIKRARSIGRQIGILIEVYRGTELGGDQRRALCKDTPGSKARGIPSQHVMTICPPRRRARISTPKPGRYAHVLMNFPLPPVGGLCVDTSLLLELTVLPGKPARKPDPPPAAPEQRRTGAAGARLAAATLTHPALRGLFGSVTQPRRAGGQLAPYASGGWSATELAVELYDQARRRHIPTGMPARNPWALLKALLDGIDPVADVHLRRGSGFAAPQPCGRPECDHGWIELPDGRVTPCTHCPIEVRRWFAEAAG